MRYIVHTRQSIQSIAPQLPHLIISISTPETEKIPIRTNVKCRGLLRLCFDDADQAIHLVGAPARPVTLFSAEMADTLLEFCLPYADVSEVYVHCDAGQCRSPAIAAALQKIETGSDHEWFATKRPNMLVYRTILERAFERGLLKV